MKENEECAQWDVVWDDRGHFEEPHGGQVVGLGTLSVRGYLGEVRDLEISPAGFKDAEIKTHGPHGRFGALLFVEKEGFNDLFRSVQLAERFDIAIMWSKGVSVTAARPLADQLSIPLLTLHDFDVAGFTIGRIGEDTDRYTFENDIDVINIGLRLRDVEDLEHDGAVVLDDLAETCKIRGDYDKKRETLEEIGVTALVDGSPNEHAGIRGIRALLRPLAAQ